MRLKLFLGLSVAVVLSVAAVALAGGFTKPPAPVSIAVAQPAPCADQPCCTDADCCPECIACCAIDGCCEECIECCIEMGCDPSCCFPALTSAKAEAPKKAEASCAQPAKKGQACCADGCCK